MRRILVLGFGLAGALSCSTAPAQFASDPRPGVPPAPPPAGGFTPAPAPPAGFNPPAQPPGAAPVGPSAPLTGPAEVEIPSALGPNHPLAVRPEHGAWFVCVKSYSRPSRPDPNDPGPTARELAEALAGEIQQAHPGWAVHLFEYVSEEKKAEFAARAAAVRQRQAFLASLDTYRTKSRLQDMSFMEPDRYIRYKTFNYRDQIAVLVGGYRTEEEAHKALLQVRKWQPPRDNRLMDGTVIGRAGMDGKGSGEKGYLNPFAQCMLVPNPTVPRQAAAAGQQPGMGGSKLDPFIAKLNDGRPYSLLKAKKGWTLAVKSFTAPVTIQSREDEGGSFMRKMGFKSGSDALAAGAEQAEVLAKTLRLLKGPGGQPLNLEAFVLHTRNASIVTVGQFDGPDDPALLEMQRLLRGMTFMSSKDGPAGAMNPKAEPFIGPNFVPTPVPKP
jgi:hypothetical protein